MQRVTGIGHFGVRRFRVDLSQDTQTSAFYHVKQLLAAAQLQMLGEIGQDQPAFSAGQQVRGQTFQKSAQHSAVGIEDRMLKR